MSGSPPQFQRIFSAWPEPVEGFLILFQSRRANPLRRRRAACCCPDLIGARVESGFLEYALCPQASAFEMPEAIPLPDAAALYFPFHLAWLGLFDRADLQAGESVLIHAAAGGSGSAAIQLAVHAGARVFATASSEEKLKLCRELGAHVTINYNESDFAQIVTQETGDRGVDVVFDNVGWYWVRLVKALRTGLRWRAGR